MEREVGEVPGVRVDTEELEDLPHPETFERYSTGVVSFDAIVKGGVPVGSLVLLLGDEGAGAIEFALTSASKLSMVRDKPDMMKFIFGDFYSRMRLPERVTYISISRTRTDLLREVEASFNPDLAEAFSRHVEFVDFSYHFFKDSPVPDHWIVEDGAAGPRGERGPRLWKVEGDIDLFEHLVKVIEEHASGGIVFVDSLTDLVINEAVDDQELMMLLKGFQRVLHQWNGVVFFLLHRGTMERVEETRLKDCFDAVMVFEWVKAVKSSKRQRYMHFEKFRGVLPVLDREDIIRFNTEVSYASGFVVVNAERIA